MGCDLLALDFVRNWEFLERTGKDDAYQPLIEFNPPHHFGSRSSVTIVDDPAIVAAGLKFGITGIGGGVGSVMVKPAVTVFEESSMDWAF